MIYVYKGGNILWEGYMKMVSAIIKHHKLDDVRKALVEAGVKGMTTVEVKGFGRQKGHKEVYRGAEYVVNFVPKVKVEVAVERESLDDVVGAILSSARTGEQGEIGDGKIFVYGLENVVRIRTGSTGKEAL
jgi:nitrogen regulatory protein PII